MKTRIQITLIIFALVAVGFLVDQAFKLIEIREDNHDYSGPHTVYYIEGCGTDLECARQFPDREF